MSDLNALITLDVCEDLRGGFDPLQKILGVVDSLTAEQGLRLLAPFEPIPLYHVLKQKGFAHEAERLEEGRWEIRFRRADNPPAESSTRNVSGGPSASADSGAAWSPPQKRLDNRGLTPPDPLVRILEALEHLPKGQVLEALNDRDPVFLYPELEARGHAIVVEKVSDGVRIRIRAGGAP